MNQKNTPINLRKVIGGDSASGNIEGRLVYQKLLTILDSFPENAAVGISLKGVIQTDASFPRESVISLAKTKIGKFGFYICDLEGKDLRDNWHYAALAIEQPIIIFEEKGFSILGPELSSSGHELLNFIMKKDSVTTSMIAEHFDLTAQNASGKLKKLMHQGLILGYKDAAESGGLEYVFKAIK